MAFVQVTSTAPEDVVDAVATTSVAEVVAATELLADAIPKAITQKITKTFFPFSKNM